MIIQFKDKKFEMTIYTQGISYCSVCTNMEDIGLITAELNLRNHSGIGCGWRFAEEPFRDGTPNPCPCNDEKKAKEGFKHYLFET